MNSSFSMILVLLALTSSIVTAEAKFKCGEKRKDVFFYLKNIKTGEGKEKNCGWLKTQKRKKNKRIFKKACKQRQEGPNGLLPAKRVCPSVCGRPRPPGPTLEPSAVPSFEPSSSSIPTSTPSAAPSISSQPTLGSCIGIFACTGSSNLTTSPNSCRGDYSCRSAENVVVKEGSCHGEDSCYGAEYLEVGPNSCRGETSCSFASGRIGSNSCNCPCSFASGRIGSNSCNCPGNSVNFEFGCCGWCSPLANVPDDACNTDENGVPVNADDFTDGGVCKYCLGPS